ncbi:MAG: hypothetical protein KKC03_13180 [Bacteroidetes bacterium]|nr:hypothetical protein [Bacteroidota bacterium]
MNKITGKTTWPRLCELSIRMTNSIPRTEARLGLVYMSDCSFGGREVSPRADYWRPPLKPRHVVEDGDFGGWMGYGEPDVHRLKWTSGSSGASIEALLVEGEWEIHFVGREEGDHESQYIVDFLSTATGLTEVHLDNPERILSYLCQD